METTKNQSFYDILGVSESASKEEIRKAYLALARKHHPDKTGGDKAAEAELKGINEAYHTLKNEERRRVYDAERRNAFASGMGAGAAGPEGFSWSAGDGSSFSFRSSGLDDDAFSDMFEAFFGASPGAASMGGRTHRAHRTPTRGGDISIELPITLEEAAKGPQKRIRLSRKAASGAKEPATVSVQIPAGVHDGARLRLAGQGHAGPQGATQGDLIVRIRLKEHPLFTRKGDDLHLALPISFPEAALGATVRVPTLAGKADLRVPAGTQSGKQFRLRGLGMPRAHGGHGDLIVGVTVEIPSHLTAEQRELVAQLQAGESPRQYANRTGFWDKLKKLGGVWAGFALMLAAAGLVGLA